MTPDPSSSGRLSVNDGASHRPGQFGVAVTDRSDIGISTGAFMDWPLAHALERIGELAPAAEVCSWGSHSLLHYDNVKALEATALPFSVHGPFTHDGLGSRLTSKRRKAVELHRHILHVAGELGATAYVLHPDLNGRRRPWNPKVAAALERSFDELRQVQGEVGVRILVENMPYNGHSHYAAPGDLDLQGLDLALDIGHAAITGTLTRWLTDPQATMRLVHIHDNGGFNCGDDHDALGTGAVDPAPALALARAAGATIVLENKSEAAVLASLEHLRVRGLLPVSVG